MTTATETIVKTALANDTTIDARDAKAALAVLKGESPINAMPTGEGDTVISRKQVAVMIGKSAGMVDIYGRRGVFRRVYFTKGGKRKQSQGYSRKSVLEAIRNGAIGDGAAVAASQGE